jgi:hypothetical protein
VRGQVPRGLTPGQKFNPAGIFVGSFVPNVLLRMPDVSSSAKLVWARLAQFAAATGTAWPSQSTLAREIGVQVRQICRLLDELEKRGLIVREAPSAQDRGQGATTKYFFLWHEDLEKDLLP